jgi:hypothetical protein
VRRTLTLVGRPDSDDQRTRRICARQVIIAGLLARVTRHRFTGQAAS